MTELLLGLGGRFAQLGLGGEMDPSQFYPQQEGYEMSSDETFREILGKLPTKHFSVRSTTLSLAPLVFSKL